MRQRLHSISSLRAFEAAALHLNLRRAAADLCITESAVSRQIVALEGLLGVALFLRANKRVTLTAAGVQYSRQVRAILQRLAQDTLGVMAHEGAGGIVELACVPTLAVEWLIPRLPDFYGQHPQVVVNISAMTGVFLFEHSQRDAAIHFGSAAYPGARTDPLFGEESVVVCRPDFFKGRRRPTLQDIAAAPRLHLATRDHDWQRWMQSAGIESINPMSGARFEHHTMIISGVRAGLGVGLVPRFLVRDYLAQGLLANPTTHALRSADAYYFVAPDDRPMNEATASFREWLIDAAQAYSGAEAMPLR